MTAASSDAADSDAAFEWLLAEIRNCRRCAHALQLGPRPIVRGRPTARLLIISQAPGTRVHETGLSFNDRSGDRLRLWLGLDRDTFYDERRVAIMGMGFCYPGRDARGGDLPPRPECAPLWHPVLRPHFREIALTLLVGSHAIRHYLPESRRDSMTAVLARLSSGDFRVAASELAHHRLGARPPLVRGRGLAGIARRGRRGARLTPLSPRARSCPYPRR